MIKRFLLFIAVFHSVFCILSFAQNTLITSEDFEGANYITALNDTGLASNIGPNNWIINNQFSGGALYPNTIVQDSTYGGFITLPNGNYLHIHDSVAATNNGIANTNYDPLSASDRLAIVKEFCTLGFSDVTVAYYYLCMGDTTNAYGEVYYSINNGTWTPFPGATYRNTYKWKYTELIDPIFDNKSSVRIGFRWTNNSTNTPLKASFAIDDIRIVGNFDNGLVGITIDTLQLVPVCQNFNFLALFSLTNPLCGQGFYQVELSNAAGNFNNPTNLGIYQLNNLDTNQALFLNIPANTPPGNCYKIRITRIDVTPNVVSTISACFEVLLCPNTITTLQPVMLSNPQDTICVGSVIDVPFFSTGVYTNNTYVAQLSDSAGNFPINPNVLGTFPNSQTYDPALGSTPGYISGLLLANTQAITEGCNYYIRVVSDSNIAISGSFGPFCIRNCDINSSEVYNIHACINSTLGFDTLLSINIHQYDSLSIYSPTNLFQIQLLNGINFNIENTGSLGFINATEDTTMQITIPNLGDLLSLGLHPGLYYARIVATSTTSWWNNLGTLFRVIIGAPMDVPLSIYSYEPLNFTGFMPISDSTVCQGQAIYFILPNANATSEYVWTLNNNTNWANGTSTGVLFNQSGDYYMNIIETSFGCVGPSSDTAIVHVIGTASATITGPSQVIANDTVTYTSPFNMFNSYNWSCLNAQVVNNNTNNFELTFPNAGNYQVVCTVSNSCTSSTANKNITVASGLGTNPVQDLNGIEILGNVNDGTFQIKFHNTFEAPYFLQIYNTNGLLVYSTSINENQMNGKYDYQIYELNAGIYYLQICSKSQSKVFKIVKV